MKKIQQFIKMFSVGALALASHVALSDGGNKLSQNGTGYIFNFNHEGGGISGHQAINCFSNVNPFSKPGISASGMANQTDDYLSIRYDGSQDVYSTCAIRFFNNTTCGSVTADLSNPSFRIVKARIKSSQAIQIGVFVGFDKSGFWTAADGTGFQLVQLAANTWTELTFTVPTVNWQNASLDMTKALGVEIGVRNTANPDQKPTGIVDLLVDWIKVGEEPTAPVNSNNKSTGSGKGYSFNFDGGSADNCAVGNTAMIPAVNYFTNSRDGYTLSNTFNGNLNVSTNGTQLGTGGYQLTLHDNALCSNSTINLSNHIDRKIEIRIKSSVDVPQVLALLVDNNFLVADKSPTVKSLTANTWTILTFDASVMQTFGNVNVDPSNIGYIWLSFRKSWDDNAGGATPSVIGSFEIDYIKIGDAIAPVTSVEEVIHNSTASVYPNPSTGIIQFDKGITLAKIYTIDGNLYKEVIVDTIDQINLPSGMFVAKLYNAETLVSTQKIIITK